MVSEFRVGIANGLEELMDKIEIEIEEITPEFVKCWKTAGLHIQHQPQDGLHSWLRADLYPPLLEHLSFSLGNQLFFIRIEDVDDHLQVPSSVDRLLAIAYACKKHACLMPMKKNFLGGGWVPDSQGWGLLDARTNMPIDPFTLVTAEKIEMTAWELHDFAVQVVRDQLRKEGYKLMSSQGDPGVDPAIWFVGDSKEPEWVVVRAVRYPAHDAKRPDNWNSLANDCSKLSNIGHFASVALCSVDQTYDTASDNPVPLWRGHGVHVN
jgi:hypothetical protein